MRFRRPDYVDTIAYLIVIICVVIAVTMCMTACDTFLRHLFVQGTPHDASVHEPPDPWPFNLIAWVVGSILAAGGGTVGTVKVVKKLRSKT